MHEYTQRHIHTQRTQTRFDGGGEELAKGGECENSQMTGKEVREVDA